MTPHARDFLGLPIEPGDRIAYPVRAGSSLWMTLARVAKVEDDHTLLVHRLRVSTYTPAGGLDASRPVRLHALDRVVNLTRAA